MGISTAGIRFYQVRRFRDCVIALSLLLAIPASAQSVPSKTVASADPPTRNSSQKGDAQKAAGTRPEAPPPVLQQLNSALEELTNRISPAVVQVLVTGYGPVEDGNRNETALIARQHALGS